jgi:hypothetical protein
MPEHKKSLTTCAYARDPSDKANGSEDLNQPVIVLLGNHILKKSNPLLKIEKNAIVFCYIHMAVILLIKLYRQEGTEFEILL